MTLPGHSDMTDPLIRPEADRLRALLGNADAERDRLRDAIVAVLNSRKHSQALDIAMNALGQAAAAARSPAPPFQAVAHRAAQDGPNHPGPASSTTSGAAMTLAEPPAKEIYGDKDGTFWFKRSDWTELEARRAAAQWAGIPTRSAKAHIIKGIERQAGHGGWYFEIRQDGEPFWEVEAHDD